MHVFKPPIGAIENGREHFRRLAEHYGFTCEAGPLQNCADFEEVQRCFEVMAEWIAYAANLDGKPEA